MEDMATKRKSKESSPSESFREYTSYQHDRRPSDYEYALMANQAYENLKKRSPLPGYGDWRVEETKQGNYSYYGVIYVNHKTKQVVLAHRGTANVKNLIEDMNGIFLNRLSPQKESAFEFVSEAVQIAKDLKYHLSFTGHSLGGFLAEVSVYYCHHIPALAEANQFGEVNAVSFESPGCRESLEDLQSHVGQTQIDLNKLDILGYVSYPNLVNTCNHHVGTLYALKTEVGPQAWIPGWHLLKVHSMDNIVAQLDPRENYVAPYVLDWPMGSQRKHFFKCAELIEGHYELPERELEEIKAEAIQEAFQLAFKAHYLISDSLTHRNVLPLVNFPVDMREWLKDFYRYFLAFERMEGRKVLLEGLHQRFEALKVPENIQSFLMLSMITQQKNKVKSFSIQVPEDFSVDFSVQEVRSTLSKWLSKQPEAAAELLKYGYTLGGRFSESEVADIQMGATAGGKVIAFAHEFPEDTDKRNIEYMKDLDESTLRYIKETHTKFVMTAEGQGSEAITVSNKVKARKYPKPKSDEAYSNAALINQQREREKRKAKEAKEDTKGKEKEHNQDLKKDGGDKPFKKK